MNTIKRCGKCGDLKPVSAFSKYQHAIDGVQRYCKSCYRAWRRADKAGRR